MPFELVHSHLKPKLSTDAEIGAVSPWVPPTHNLGHETTPYDVRLLCLVFIIKVVAVSLSNSFPECLRSFRNASVVSGMCR